jgi:hypothetical protein
LNTDKIIPSGSSEASPSKRKRVSEISTTSDNTQKTTPVTEVNCCNLNEIIIEGLREDNSKLETSLKESLKENGKKDDTIESLNARIVELEEMLKNTNISSEIGNQNKDSERCNNNEETTSENSTVFHAPDLLAADSNEIHHVQVTEGNVTPISIDTVQLSSRNEINTSPQNHLGSTSSLRQPDTSQVLPTSKKRHAGSSYQLKKLTTKVKGMTVDDFSSHF